MLKDNYDFFKDYDREQAEWLASRPICASCGEPIQDEYAWPLDGLYCEECKDTYLENIKVNVDDFVDEQRGEW